MHNSCFSNHSRYQVPTYSNNGAIYLPMIPMIKYWYIYMQLSRAWNGRSRGINNNSHKTVKQRRDLLHPQVLYCKAGLKNILITCRYICIRYSPLVYVYVEYLLMSDTSSSPSTTISVTQLPVTAAMRNLIQSPISILLVLIDETTYYDFFFFFFFPVIDQTKCCIPKSSATRLGTVHVEYVCTYLPITQVTYPGYSNIQYLNYLYTYSILRPYLYTILPPRTIYRIMLSII